MVPSSFANMQWVTNFGVVDNVLTGEESTIGTHIGVVIVNQSTEADIFDVGRIQIANTPIIGGEYGFLPLSTDVLNRNQVGTLSNTGELSEGILSIDPGEAVYFSAKIQDVPLGFSYDGGTFSGDPFDVDTEGVAASYMSIRDSFVDGTIFGTVGLGRDDVAAWSFQTAIPEPSSYALMVGGIAFICLFTRRRR